MNILILSCGSRSDIVNLLRTAAGSGGKIITADADPWAAALYEADEWYLIPPVGADDYIERVLELSGNVSAVIPVTSEAAAALASCRERIEAGGAALIVSEEALQAFFGDGLPPALASAYRDCFAVETSSVKQRLRKAVAKRIPADIKQWLWLLPDRLTSYRKNKRVIRRETGRIVYLLDTPRHDNLGDHAIALAQRRFIEKALPDARILEVPIELVDMHLGFIRRHIRPDDLFCLIGGGNFGDVYVMHEHTKRKICAMFPEHRVIIFPQTISYSDTPQGRRELELTREALCQHKHLTITARDRMSHRRAREWFPDAACILTPDIVLSLEPVVQDVPRKGILCCLRRDLERNSSLSAADVVTALAAGGYAFDLSDTTTGTRISLAERSGVLNGKWREFCGAELVITDRLHGMIFSCITSTPCIVIDNYNHKIRNFYETWLQGVPSVRFARTADDILPLTAALLAERSAPWDSALLAEQYAPLLEALRKDPRT